MKTYGVYNCGTFEYHTEEELRAQFNRSLELNGSRGWASEYKSFEDYIETGMRAHRIYVKEM